MPLTFIEIETAKSRKIWVFFLVLLFLYFAILASLMAALAQTASVPFEVLFGPREILLLTAASLIAAMIHFIFSALDGVGFIRNNLGAVAPDPEDGVHKQLLNILQEIQVVTGHKRKIDGLVIPTLAMNALAIVDLRGRATIAITEGLLSRLNRAQIEAVMAHEAYHILSGDCLETTIAASLFGLPASALEKFSAGGNRARLPPALLLTWGLLKLSRVLHLFISREREYRADAGAVRMTRNPLALAEALDLLSRNWRGIGSIGEGLEMLCLVSPTAKALDEAEGWWADLMSTHPPIRKRIEVLSKMAHVGLSYWIKNAKPKSGSAAANPPAPVFYALDPQHMWQGPYAPMELSALPWISPLTWISDGSEAVKRAWTLPQIAPMIFMERLGREDKPLSSSACPSCRQPLLETSYERTQVSRCHFCGGVLIENSKIPRIMARRESVFSDRVRSLSRAVMEENREGRSGSARREISRDTVPPRNCPRCKNPMTRAFYTLTYRVEIDRCSFCGLTWFDQDELEMLQCMIANKMASNPLERSPNVVNRPSV